MWNDGSSRLHILRFVFSLRSIQIFFLLLPFVSSVSSVLKALENSDIHYCMAKNNRGYLRRCLLLPVLLLPMLAQAQHLIEYRAGLGRRSADLPDTWILAREVRAEHEGMVLYCDSALLNTQRNDFTAFGTIEIVLSDTTFLYGRELYYDGNARQLDIWDDTVLFIDGGTVLYTDHLHYDRIAKRASYRTWGRTIHGIDTMESTIGVYDAGRKEVHVYDRVVLRDSASRLLTDTLHYHVNEHLAFFHSPTRIYSDSSMLYSSNGRYDTQRRYALSTRDSYIRRGGQTLQSDTLHYYENEQYGRALSHVHIRDSANNVSCYGHYGETDQRRRLSFVTDSAMVVYVQEQDTLYMHADTIRVQNTEAREVRYIQAYRNTRLYRRDVQTVCDSVHFLVPDSLLYLHGRPVLWQNSQQCSADTIVLHTTGDGVRRADLNGHCFIAERVDAEKYNQVKGADARVYFRDNEPTYADILGNAEMVYYITEEQGPHKQLALIGVNVGVGSDMRLYFSDRKPVKVVTYTNPDMYTYPLSLLPKEKQQLDGFSWQEERRPHSKEEIFMTECH